MREAQKLLEELKGLEAQVLAEDKKYSDIQSRLRAPSRTLQERVTTITAARKDLLELPKSSRREKLLASIDKEIGEGKALASKNAEDETRLKNRLLEDGAKHREIFKRYGSTTPRTSGVDLKKCLFDPKEFEGAPVNLTLVRVYPAKGGCRIAPLTDDALMTAYYEDPSDLSKKISKAYQLQGEYDTVTVTVVYDSEKWWVLDVKM
jgi:hypothetical protein